MNALVVDDSKTMRMVLGKFLTEIGFAVTYAGHGREALECLGRGLELEVMLVDWNMPEMNGLELIQAVRADHRMDRVRIMMVTTETSLASVSTALAAGADEYVMKPFTREVLEEKLVLLRLL